MNPDQANPNLDPFWGQLNKIWPIFRSWVGSGLASLLWLSTTATFLTYVFLKCSCFLIFKTLLQFFFSGMRMAAVIHIYYLSKPLEFLDTIFFVATKKFRNVSKLQVIHHAVMPFFTFCLVRWLPNGNFTFYFANFIFKMFS